MAERRMFAKTIIDSDIFLDMPLSTQALYFHLSMRADDDGFINNPKKIQRMIGCSDDDIKLLIAKNFLIPFESEIACNNTFKELNIKIDDSDKNNVKLVKYTEVENVPVRLLNRLLLEVGSEGSDCCGESKSNRLPSLLSLLSYRDPFFL